MSGLPRLGRLHHPAVPRGDGPARADGLRDLDMVVLLAAIAVVLVGVALLAPAP